VKLSGLLHRTRSELPGVSGVARVDRHTAALLRRLRPGDVAVLEQVDLDRATADALVVADVAAVVNSRPGKVFVLGHSFGGAIAVRTACALGDVVKGVVTFATQSAGCEQAEEMNGRPFLLFHGDRDELLPPQASEMVRFIAGSGELVLLPGEGHLLSGAGDLMLERTLAFVDETFA